MSPTMITVDKMMVGMMLLLLLPLLTCVMWSSGVTALPEFQEGRKHPRARRRSEEAQMNIDDTVLLVAYHNSKARKLPLAPDIPALTDKTFPATVYNASTKLVVVLFYIPYDPVGMLFLEQYEEAGRELAARGGMGGNSSSTQSHPLARVNCFDWTDVCQKENITTYPVIHLYQQGKLRQQYRDALDKDVLVRAVSLLQSGQPLRLRKEEEVMAFVNGELPDNVHPLVDSLVLLKPSASLAEEAAFTEVVRQLETKMLFAIVSPDVQTQIGVEVGVLHVRRSDRHQPYDTLTHSLDTKSIRHFLLTGQFQLLPELTYRNFPELFKRGHPLGILFIDPAHSEAQVHVRTVVDVIKSQRVKNVTFCTIGVDGENEMAIKLLRIYTERSDVPAFVLVDLQNRKVFTFTKWTPREKKLLDWILLIQTGKLAPTSRLPKGTWEPKSRHIDFLDKIYEDEKAKKKQTHHQDLPDLDNDDDVDDDDGFESGEIWIPEMSAEDTNFFSDENIPPPPPEVLEKLQRVVIQNRHNRDQNPNQNRNQNYPNQNQHRRNQNNRDQIPNQNRNQNYPNQNEHRRNQNNRDQIPNQNQNYPNQNEHRRNQNNRDQIPNQNRNQHYPNQNQHKRSQNKHQQNGNKNQQNPNQKSQNIVKEKMKKEKTKIDGRLEDFRLESDKEQKYAPSPSSAEKKHFRTLPIDEATGMKKGIEKNMEKLKPHTEL